METPKGWILVPVVPTLEMVRYARGKTCPRDVWEEMVYHAPEPPTEERK